MGNNIFKLCIIICSVIYSCRPENKYPKAILDYDTNIFSLQGTDFYIRRIRIFDYQGQYNYEINLTDSQLGLSAVKLFENNPGYVVYKNVLDSINELNIKVLAIHKNGLDSCDYWARYEVNKKGKIFINHEAKPFP